MSESTFFFDTNALIEIISGNSNYEQYSDCNVITSVFNLSELNYILKKEMVGKKADKYTEDYFSFLASVALEDIQKAMDLKSEQRNLSILDAIGYTIAKRLNVKFLTGDEDFRDFDNVEFVKK